MALLHIIPAFALTALVLAMVPGQGVAMVLRQTMIGGARCAYISVAGNSLGLVIWGLASAIGLSQVFAHSHLAYNILKFAGVAFLVFLAVQTLIELRNVAGKFRVDGQARVRPRGGAAPRSHHEPDERQGRGLRRGVHPPVRAARLLLGDAASSRSPACRRSSPRAGTRPSSPRSTAPPRCSPSPRCAGG